MPMKTTKLLLAGIILSSGVAVAQEQSQVSNTPLAPNKLNSFTDVSKYQHRIQPIDKHVPKPPRLVAPNEYQRIQEKLAEKFQPKESSPALQILPKNMRKFSLNDENASTGCTSTDDLIGLTGEDLISSLKTGNLNTCLYGLYNNQLAEGEIFSDANLVTVVQSINTMLATYQGTNETGAIELEKLITYLRAMHWVESSTGRVFQSDYQTTLDQAFDTYFTGDYFTDFNGSSSRDFMIRFEMLILVNSSNTNRLKYLARFSEALLGYANSISRTDDWGVYYEEQGFTNLLVHFFNASNGDEEALKATILNKPEIIDHFISFVESDGLWLVDHTREYQWADTISELGRFLKFGGEIANKVRPSIANILSTYAYNERGSSGWVNAQSMVKFYDSANCDAYGDACNFDLENAVLSGNYACSDTVKMRYQGNISNENLIETCNILNAGQEKFHRIFGTNATTPVADDNNEALEVVVFNSSTDYESYAGDFFGIGTDNGGMYLEDTPENENSQARFIAFQATWLPGFSIWNLEHEQYHYLDGRFNKWGGFNDQAANSVWWAEGLAEYLSQPADNAKALAAAPSNTYQLSELFQTTYENSNQSRTYTWGYLATRFMMENHRGEIDNELLPSMRAAKYSPSGGGTSNEGCIFDWSWQAKPDAEANNWLWLYDDSQNGSGYWVWTCGQPNTDEVPDETPTEPLPEYTPYQDIINNWSTNFDDEFNIWLSCIVDGEGYCQDQQARKGDLDNNQAIDKRDISIMSQLLRQPSDNLGLEYDFNHDEQVNRKDIRSLMKLCDLNRCAIVSSPQ
jgi:microbial collagenase